MPTERENKPEAGAGKLGSVTRIGGVTGVGAGEAPMDRELPGISGTQVWGAAVLSSRRSQEWGRQAYCPEVCLCIDVAGRRVISFILIFYTLLSQPLYQDYDASFLRMLWSSFVC